MFLIWLLGLLLGAAFSAIVNSLVEDLISPIIVSLTSQAAIEDLSVKIGTATLRYGNFLQAIIDFLIIALVLFLIIKAANKFKRQNPEMDVLMIILNNNRSHHAGLIEIKW